MKKTNKIVSASPVLTAVKKVFAFSALSVLSTAWLLSCGDNAGLGVEVDLTAPVITLTSHADNDTVPSAFTLEGTASDNEKVTRIYVACESAGLYYQVSPGGKWQKRTDALTAWTDMDDGDGSCVVSDSASNTWNWTLYVDTAEKDGTYSDASFSFTITAEDTHVNTSADSKADISLIVDENSPDVSIYKPDLLTGAYTAVAETVGTTDQTGYQLQDGNVIGKLLNGDLTFSGRQSNSLDFKELRIEFDNGGLSAGTMKVTGDVRTTAITADDVAQDVSLDENETPTVYYAKTLKVGEDGIADLRNWTVTIPASEWVNAEKNPELQSGKHLIRIVTTSVSGALAWQRKVVGYFVWWQEADTPWITTYIGDDADQGENAYGVYPGANFSGTAQDDDGIASLVYTIQQKGDDGAWNPYTSATSLALSDDGAKYTAWSLRVPSENGNYRLDVTVTDVNGTSSAITKYFKTLDVQPPKITIATPANGSSVLADSAANITFTGTVSDDGSISSFVMVYLNPAESNNPENKIKYLSGLDSNFAKATAEGFTDSDGNKLYAITLGEQTYDEAENVWSYPFERTFNLFTDLGIDGDERLLETQDFIFRALDNGNSNTVQQLSLAGDTEQPVLTIDTITIYDANDNVKRVHQSNDEGELPVILTGDYAVVSGTWSDNSTTAWANPANIGGLSVEWSEAEFDVVKKSDGTWTAKVTQNQPTTSGVISARIKDWGGNEKVVSTSVLVTGAAASLERIASSKEDGAYKAGDKITIALEFSKNVKATYSTPPTLTLNTGATAVYTGTEGTMAASHTFEYVVRQGDTVEKLGVTALNDTGVTWEAADDTFTPVLPTVSSKKLETTRNIRIDTTAPTITSVTAITPAGYYTTGASILLMLTFSEPVTATAPTGFTLHFNNDKTSTSSAMSGSKNVLFTYDVTAGDDTTGALVLTSVEGGGTITDEAGNTLADYTLPATTLNNAIYIDTTAPAAPVVTPEWGSSTIVFDSTSFTVSGEDGATIEYTIDGTNLQTYKNEVSLSNNGKYTIKARQTDRAGNSSAESAATTVTIDKGEMLTSISATTVNGTYSTNTATKQIDGTITFRKAVTIAQGATVTLNVKNDSSTTKTVPINECRTAAASNTVFTFTYEIAEGDSINATDGLLDVTDWSFSEVTVSDYNISLSMNFADVAAAKRFKANREIKVITGVPQIVENGVTLSDDNTKLTITYDRDITKVSGTLTFTQSADDYRVPTVLSVSEYSELLSVLSTAGTYYSKGVNGATLTGTIFTNDTTTKYILNDTYTNKEEALIKAFRDNAKKHIVTIPVVSSAVVASGRTLTVTLGTAYALPVKGAQYSLDIPANIVVDAVQNKNAASTHTITAHGVEAPSIRIKKDSYTITNAGNTKTASVTMPATASMRIDCRTPGATIMYGMNKITTTAVRVTNKNTKYTSQEAADRNVPEVPSANTAYTDGTLSLGDAISGYSTAQGQKFAIVATATKGTATATSYEYATRTVLRLRIDNNYDSGKNSSGEQLTHIKESNGTTVITADTADDNLKFKDLKVWIIGGDSSSGGNSIGTFPLSWSDSASFKLMNGKFSNIDDDTYNMHGEWYWVTWELSAPAYHGFVIGDVPSDVATNGPTCWYAAECTWVGYKDNYVLYPGETVEMLVTDGTSTPNFLFRLKNQGTR